MGEGTRVNTHNIVVSIVEESFSQGVRRPLRVPGHLSRMGPIDHFMFVHKKKKKKKKKS